MDVTKFTNFVKGIEEFIGSTRNATLTNRIEDRTDELRKKFSDAIEKIPKMLNFSSNIIEKELKKTTKRIEQVTKHNKKYSAFGRKC